MEISATWPERLTFTVVYGDKAVRVGTRLYGEHHLGSAMAALGAAVAAGMPFEDAAAALELAAPLSRRLMLAQPTRATIRTRTRTIFRNLMFSPPGKWWLPPRRRPVSHPAIFPHPAGPDNEMFPGAGRIPRGKSWSGGPGSTIHGA